MATTDKNQIFGREHELAVLSEALTLSLKSTPQLVLLVGEPGIGKTRLVEEVADSATDQNMRVVWGACLDGGGAPPHWPWIQILESLERQSDGGIAALDSPTVASLAKLIPGIVAPEQNDSATESEDEFTIARAIRDIVSRTATASPTLLILEDIHWADEASLQALDLLAHSLRDLPLMMIATYRDTDVARTYALYSMLPSLSRAPGTKRISVSGLDSSAINQIITSVSERTGRSLIGEKITERTAGNPFFAREIALSLDSAGGLSDQLVPEGVREVVGRRLSVIDPVQLETLRIGSVVGRNFSALIVSEVLKDTAPADVAELCESLVERGLLTESADRPFSYSFAHSLIQETVLSEITTSRKMRTHAAIATALESRHGSKTPSRLSQIANHYLESEPLLGPDKALDFALAASRHAFETGAFESVVRLSERAIDIGNESSHSLVGEFLVLRARAGEIMAFERYSNQLRWDWTATAFKHYEMVGDTDRAIDVALIAGSLGGVVGSSPVLERAVELVEDDDPREPWVMLRYGVALDNDDGDYDRAMEIFLAVAAKAESSGDDPLRARALAHCCQTSLWTQKYAEGYEYGRLAISLAVEIREWATLGRTLHFWGFATIALGTANENYHTVLNLDNELIPPDWRASSLRLVANVHFVLGNWSAASQAWHEWVDLVGLDTVEPSKWALADLLRGADITWSDDLEIELAEFSGTETVGVIWALQYATGLLSASRFSLAPGLDSWVLNVAAAVDSTEVHPRRRQFDDCARAMAAIIGKNRAEAERLLPHFEELGHHMDAGSGTSIDHITGLLQVLLDDPKSAAASFETALSFCKKAEYWPEFVRSSLAYADLLASTGDNSRGVEVTTAALVQSKRLEMELFTRELAAHQEQFTSAAVTLEDAGEFPDGLSQREVEVLRHIAAGRSNQEIADELFLSRYTVVRHVSNIFGKTGTSNRAEAATYANQNGLVEESTDA